MCADSLYLVSTSPVVSWFTGQFAVIKMYSWVMDKQFVMSTRATFVLTCCWWSWLNCHTRKNKLFLITSVSLNYNLCERSVNLEGNWIQPVLSPPGNFHLSKSRPSAFITKPVPCFSWLLDAFMLRCMCISSSLVISYYPGVSTVGIGIYALVRPILMQFPHFGLPFHSPRVLCVSDGAEHATELTAALYPTVREIKASQ